MPEHSPYEEVELPKFESSIPESLLKNATDQERYVMNTLSKQTHVLDFVCTTLVHLSKNLKQTDSTAILAAAKVQELENKIERHNVRIQALEEARKTYQQAKEWKEKGKFSRELRDFVSLISWRPFQIFMLFLIIVGALLGPTGLMAIWKFILNVL